MITLKRLTSDQIKKIQSVKHVFEQAEKFTGVPWQAIAAIWYRESFSVAPPKTPGGPFQFDPMPPYQILKGLLMAFAPFIPSPIMSLALVEGLDVFEYGAIFCACWLRHQCKFDLSRVHSDDAVKDAFYGYNGRAWGPYPESSPYVYNEFDAQHKAMKIRGSIPLPTGGRKFISTTDLRPGAFTVYKQLIEEKV